MLETDNLPNTTLWVQGNGYIQQNATLNIPAGLTNHGTILLESANAGYSDTLALAGTFTNAADGVIQVTAGLRRPAHHHRHPGQPGPDRVDGASYLTITGDVLRGRRLDQRAGLPLQLPPLRDRQPGERRRPSCWRVAATRWRRTICPTRRCGCRATATSNRTRR